MHLLFLLDEPHELLRGVADLLRRRAEVQQPAQSRRVDRLGARPQHPELELLAHLVEAILELGHLRGEALVVQQQRAVREADRRLGHVLHLDQHVDGAVEVGDRRILLDAPPAATRARPRARAPRRCPRAAPRRISTSSGSSMLVAVGIDEPLAAAPDRDDAHARLHRQLDVVERAVRERRLGAHAHAVRDLLGRGEVGDERRRDAEVVRDDARDVDGRVAHALDRRHDVQHARHLLGVALRARREHAHLAHLVHELGEALLELVHLVGHARVGEEQRRVPEIDHQLGGVLRLREHGLQISWSFFH